MSFYHYDPYAQTLSKVVRGFSRDLADAKAFVTAGLVDRGRFKALVDAIPDTAYAKYPTLSENAIREAGNEFIASF